MTKLDRLIAELCPNGVEYMTLGEVARYSPIRISSKDMNAENYVGVDNLLPNKAGKKLSNNVPNSGMLTKYEVKDILIGNIRPYLKKIWLSDRVGGTNGDVLVINVVNEKLSAEYLYYLLSSDNFFIYATQHSKGGKMPRGSKVANLNYPIPLPPLDIQREIVQILDNFTELTAELAAELAARKKQYEYYRNELLTFGDDVPMVELGEIGEFVRGNGLQKKDFADVGFPCIHYGQLYTRYGLSADSTFSFVSTEFAKKLKKAKNGDLIIATTSENVDDVCKAMAWHGDEVAISGDMMYFRSSQNVKYLAYIFQTASFFEQKRKYAQGTKVIRVSRENLSKMRIPLPSLKEQGRIVEILDRFDSLVADISSGLPAEIATRQKQYEYYRDKLLTFEGG